MALPPKGTSVRSIAPRSRRQKARCSLGVCGCSSVRGGALVILLTLDLFLRGLRLAAGLLGKTHRCGYLRPSFQLLRAAVFIDCRFMNALSAKGCDLGLESHKLGWWLLTAQWLIVSVA